MKKAAGIFFSLILIVICISLGIKSPPPQTAQAANNPEEPSPAIDAPSILAATVQIYVFPAVEPSENGEMVVERGLGSLIQAGSETLIITHDHWDGLEETSKMQFLDAGGKLLVEVSGDEFRGLIRYHDGGTLLLSTPPEIRPEYQALLAARSNGKVNDPITAGQLGDATSVQVGALVTVAYRSGEGRNRVSLMPARVIEIIEMEGKAALKLQSQDGEVILPGDSGGGIWLDGRLVANMWLTEWVYDWRIWTWSSFKPEIKRLDTSRAAQLPLDAVQGALHPQETTAGGENTPDEALAGW
jgi:hypothetical protein